MCTEQIEEGALATRLPCKMADGTHTPHYFHHVPPGTSEADSPCVGNGVRQWLAEKNNSCPTCRCEHEGGATLVVVELHASWCPPCQQLKPVFRRLAMETPTARFLQVDLPMHPFYYYNSAKPTPSSPTARFLQVDVEECDAIASRFSVRTLPTIVFLRGGVTAEHEVMQTRIEGVEPYFRAQVPVLLLEYSLTYLPTWSRTSARRYLPANAHPFYY
jgi:thiol-disulfide isomerase/thioredoxin